MKIAWLCKDQFGDWTVKFQEPDRCNSYVEIIQIAYAEIIN